MQDDLFVGPRLHRDVPPECWCVTRQDLRDLRREVQKAVRERRVVPTARDQFDPADNTIGPNFYTVVEQHVKAETVESRASWALQRHPEGLRCDLFITHAWAEGIYEFIDKVLASWPRGAKHAWICTLSMPQHLNIAELIRSPRESPFARALECATHVLAVPNQVCSIYTRLWCVYEAFLSQQQGKLIHTAVRPHIHSTIRILVWVILGTMVGLVIGLATPGERRGVDVIAMMWMVICGVAPVVNMCLKDSMVRGFVHTFGSALTSYIQALAGLRWGEPSGYYFAIAPSIIYFITAEIDRGRLAAYDDEKSNLEREFKGSVLAAQCTEPTDKAAIWVDIGDAAEEVDRMIRVLMKARMSTPLWNRLAHAGFNIQDAAIMEWSPLVLGVFLLCTLVSQASTSAAKSWPLTHLAAIVLWLLVFGLLSRERRRFALRAVEKMFVAKWTITFVLSLLSQDMELVIVDSVFLGMGLLVSATPPLLLARIPCVGRFLVLLVLLRPRVRLFEGRSLPSCPACGPCGRRLKRPAPAAPAGSESPA